jgi:hypothetical protein
MNIDIRDPHALRAIQPADAALYLRSHNWLQGHTEPGRASYWTLTQNGEEYEALLLLDVQLRDYALRMGELLKNLALVENRSQGEIYSDLLATGSDVIRVRICDPESSDGSLSIEDHAQISQKTRDLILAAACSATEYRPVWHSRKPAPALEYLRSVRIGQSERGSYVLTINSPVPPFLHDQRQIVDTQETFERHVTQTLAHALHALNLAAEEAALTQEMAGFDRAINQGVSANLCDAVVGLWGTASTQRRLEFQFSWSPARQVPPDMIHRVTLAPDRRAFIQAAARQMREREPVEQFELRGPVVKLERAEGSSEGKVTLVGLVDGRQVRVVMQLADDAYTLAVDAHREGLILRAVGQLHKEGRGYLLRDPATVAVMGDEDVATA